MMMNLKHIQLIFTASFALFAMFFGSGNLLYPLGVGVFAGGNFSFAFSGLFIGGVLVPFLGLTATILSIKKDEDFFAPLGLITNLLIGFLILSLLGPFGVAPRCALVASSGVHLIFPDVPIEFLSFVFLFLSGLLILKTESFVDVIGKWLTPLLLVGLVVIIVASLLSEGNPSTGETLSSFESFTIGSVQGYQMMDLLAAIFFGRFIYTYLKKCLDKTGSKGSVKFSFITGLIAAAMLAGLYAGLVAVGAHHSLDLISIASERRLVTVAHIVLGPMALCTTAIVIALACLTTLCALIDLFASFIRVEIVKNKKFTQTHSVVLTLAITYAVSLAGFFTLASWIESILTFLYPAIIIFSCLRIFELSGRISKNTLRTVSAVAVLVSLIYSIFLTL